MRLPGIDWSQVALSGEPGSPSCSLSPERWATPGQKPGQKPGGCKGEGRPRPDLWAGFRNPGDEQCSCDAAPPVSQQIAAQPTQHIVDGTWLAGAMQLTPELADAIVGQQVRLGAEAWGAVQAVLGARARVLARRARTVRQRRRAFAAVNSGTAPLRDVVPSRLAPEEVCACETSIWAGQRFVDAVEGDDRSSGTWAIVGYADGSVEWGITPWRSLRRVEQWLNEEVYGGATDRPCVEGAEVYLRRGRTWDGSEELSFLVYPYTRAINWADPPENALGDRVIFTLQDFKATAAAPLIVTAYPEIDPARPSTLLADPIIDGRPASETSSDQPQYADLRIGFQFMSCCHVSMSHLRVRGFGGGIGVRGGSKHHDYAHLELSDHAGGGLGFGVTETDAASYGATVAAQITAICAAGAYPEQITVTDCTFRSIGYDTGGADITLGFLATNCTISGNTMTGDAVRGVDGIVAQGASSGHLIEKNRIGQHNKWCRYVEVDGAEVSAPTMLQSYRWECDGPTLLQPCASPGDSTCRETEYGYMEQYYDPASWKPTTGVSAYAEDGIDLMGVWPRTPTSGETTLVCDNVVWGHTIFAGITVNDGCSDIHVFRNRVFQNRDGIVVANSENSGWYNEGYVDKDGNPTWFLKKTEGIYVYRNLIYMNERRGIHVTSDQAPIDGVNVVSQVANVYIFNNTIAHNLSTGVSVMSNTDSAATPDGDPDVVDVFLYNNLIMRNGILGDFPDASSTMQVAWGSSIDLSSGRYVSDFNCYLGWGRRSSGEDEVIRGDATSRTMADAFAAWPALEGDGVQATRLSQLSIENIRGLVLLEGDGGMYLKFNVENAPPETIEAITYDIFWLSVCRNAGTGDLALILPGSTATISLGPDFEGSALVDEPDIGAFEAPSLGGAGVDPSTSTGPTRSPATPPPWR